MELAFESARRAGDELSRWRQERLTALNALARELGLPLGKDVEVRLKDGTTMRGVLELADDVLWVEARRDFRMALRIQRCTFLPGDIEACVRMD